jgi:hypothetical protein
MIVQERAQQVFRTGSFELRCRPGLAFPLFSPDGERDWVKGWAPTPVFPETIAFARDTVFRQGNPGEEAIWTIVDADWRTHRAEYVRVAPGSHAARIVVKVDPLDGDCSRVSVSYTVTAFGEDAAKLIASFGEEAYAEKMRDWQRLLSAHLAERKS